MLKEVKLSQKHNNNYEMVIHSFILVLLSEADLK
jgi:hypothetical protein